MTDKRLVQLTGNSTLAVSLPKEWARRYNIKKGTELSISDAGNGSLVVTTDKSNGEKEKAIINVDNATNLEELRRKFIAMYLAGFELITFKSSKKISHETRQVVLTEVRRLIGLEVTDENPNEIAVQDFFSHEDLSVEKSLRRAHLLTSGMYEDFTTAFADRNSDLVTKVISRDDEIDRLKFLLLRQLSLALKDVKILREINLNANDCVNYAVIIRNIEHIADKIIKAMKYFSEVINIKLPPELNKHFESIIEETYDIYTKSLESFLKRDVKTANSVLEMRRQLITEQEVLERIIKKPDVRFQYSMILEAMIEIAGYSAEIAEVTINQG